MDISVRLGEARKVEASVNGYTVKTDQPVADGGSGESPSPFDYFLASIATCAGYYVVDFCLTREISVDGISVTMHAPRNPETHRIENATIRIKLPEEFPKKYEKAVVRAAEFCSVKKHLEHGISFETVAHR